MKDISLQRMGGIGAILVALFSTLFCLLVLAAPQDALEPGQVSWPHVLSDYAMALAGLFGLAAVPAITDRVAHLSPGWMRWTSNLALLGFALLAVLNFWQAEYEMTTDDAAFSVPTLSFTATDLLPGAGWSWDLATEDLAVRAPRGWLEVAGIGLWIFSVSALARNGGLLPGTLSSLGIVAGVLSFYMPAGALLQLPSLQVLGFWSGVVLNPLWFAWNGVLLLRAVPASREAPVPAESLPLDPEARPLRRAAKRRRWSSGNSSLELLWPHTRSKS